MTQFRGTVRYTKLNKTALLNEVEQIETDVLAQAKILAQKVIERNIGTQYFSLPQLEAMGHPYSRRHGSGRPGGIPAGIVNKQTGAFLESFVARGPMKMGPRIGITVHQTGNMEALGRELFTGNHRLRGRPWPAHLKKELTQVMVPFIRGQLETKLRIRLRW